MRASARAPRPRSASSSSTARSSASKSCAPSTRRRVVALLRIQGIGPKAVHKLRAELGRRVDRRRCAMRSRSTACAALKGFGPKSEEKIAHALARLDEQGSVDRTPISVALPLAERILARIRRGARRDARLVLRLAAALLGDGGRHRRRRGGGAFGARHGCVRVDDVRRARARPRRVEDERGHAARDADRSAGRRAPTSSARRSSTSRDRRATTSSSASARCTGDGR